MVIRKWDRFEKYTFGYEMKYRMRREVKCLISIEVIEARFPGA